MTIYTHLLFFLYWIFYVLILKHRPCDKSVCHRCVDVIVDADKKRIECENFAKIHEIPDDGFRKKWAETSRVWSKRSIHSNQIEEFRKFLNTLDKTKQRIESKLEYGDSTIRDHCDKVRNIENPI